jgi:hypothetical protein
MHSLTLSYAKQTPLKGRMDRYWPNCSEVLSSFRMYWLFILSVTPTHFVLLFKYFPQHLAFHTALRPYCFGIRVRLTEHIHQLHDGFFV